MKTERLNLQPTGVTSLAATAAIVVFVAWMASFAIQHGGIFTNAPIASPPAASAAAQAQAQEAPDPG